MKKKEKDMKKFLMFLCGIFICVICFADTINLTWKVDNALYDTSTCTTGGDLILPTTPTKYGYTFTGWELAKMQPIEYLESTGTQYIDTGIVPTVNTVTEVDFYLTKIPSDTYASLFGAGYLQAGFSGYILFLNNTVPIQARTGSKEKPNIISNYPVSIGRYNVSLGFNKLVINNNEFYPQINNSWFTVSGTMYLFGANDSSLERRLSAVHIYYAKIYDNDTLVRDFIPVLDPSGVPCMYDKITDQFFYNSGTGQFIAGPVLNE